MSNQNGQFQMSYERKQTTDTGGGCLIVIAFMLAAFTAVGTFIFV